MKKYEPSPENDIKHNGALILYGATHKDTGKPAWAIPGGTFTTSKREAVSRLGSWRGAHGRSGAGWPDRRRLPKRVIIKPA